MTTGNKQHVAAPVQALLDHKLGMTQVWDADGHLMPLIVVQVGTSVVTRVRTGEVDGYNAVQLGFDEIPVHKVTKPMAGCLTKADVEPRRHLAEVRASATDNYELGQKLQAAVFEAGQTVDVSGNAGGRDFAGAMKHHGFAGVPASRGAHRNRRKPGSVGACATLGRVFRSLRVAGRMGNVRRTIQNLRIQAVDAEKGLLLISGAIPGPRNGVVLVHSSVKGARNV